MLGFTLARLGYLDIPGQYAKGASPGECFWYHEGLYRLGITLHLGCILSYGLLIVWRFLPKIRHRAIVFHRINGYIIIMLVMVSNAGALIIARRAFGGAVATQTAIGLLVILTTVGLAMAYYNIERLQIDQHRAWMLRTMFYLGTIITTHLVTVLAAILISAVGSYSIPMTERRSNSCTLTAQDLCNRITPPALKDPQTTPLSCLQLTFGMAVWLSLFLHVVGVEVHLALTPRETARLREVSYQRQLEAGVKKAGSAGLVVERCGDAEDWKPSPAMSPEYSG